MNPFSVFLEVVKTIFRTIAVSYKAYTLGVNRGDEQLYRASKEKEEEEERKRKLAQSEEERLQEEEKALEKGKEVAVEEPGFFGRIGNFFSRNWEKAKPIVDPILDVFTSTSVGRLILLGCAVFMFVSPIAPWLAATAAAITITGVAAGIIYDTYKSYKLGKLQKEDKLLRELTDLEGEKLKTLENLREKIQGITDPVQKREYEQILDLISKELYKFPGHEDKEYKSSLLKAFAKSALTNTPESIASFAMALVTFNPIAYSFAALSTILTYSQEVKKAKAYDDHKAELLNRMEQAKKILGISYSPGQGVKLLKDVVNLRHAENVALAELLNKFHSAVEKGEKMNVNTLMQDFQKSKGEHFKTDKIEVPDTALGKVGDFFKRMGKVVVYGFSARKTQELFSPLFKQSDYIPRLQSYVNTSNSNKNDPLTTHKSKSQEIIEERANTRVTVEEFVTTGPTKPSEIILSKQNSIQEIMEGGPQKLTGKQVAAMRGPKESWEQLTEEQRAKRVEGVGRSGSGAAPAA